MIERMQAFLKTKFGKISLFASTFLLLYLFAFLLPALHDIDRNKRILKAKEHELERIGEIGRQLQQQSLRFMAKKGENTGSFATIIETLSASSGVKPYLNSMKPLPAILDERFHGEVMEISLQAIPLAIAVNYLYALEHHPLGMSIKRLDMRKRTNNQQGLDIILQLAHIEKGNR